MPSTCVVVPFTPGQCEHRDTAWEWVRGRFAVEHPGWGVVTASGPPGDWCKAAAVAQALERTAADVLILADADVWCPGVAEAVHAVTTGASWAIPHMLVYRLNETGDGLVEKPYRGVAGGGITVLTRETYERVPMDPRFRNWGQEDQSWGFALTCLAGPAVRGTHPLIHLYHPPAARMNRAIGNPKSERLMRRYSHARGSVKRMRMILAEVNDDPARPPQPAGHDHSPHRRHQRGPVRQPAR